MNQQTADEILAEALSNINLYFGDAIIPDVPDGFSTRKKRFSKRFAQILNALVSEEPLPSVNWRDGKPYNYCPECGREEPRHVIKCPDCKEQVYKFGHDCNKNNAYEITR